MIATMPDVWLVIPTRGRPHNLGRLLTNPNTMLEANVSAMVVLDHDDPELGGYHEELRCAVRGGYGARLWWRHSDRPHPGAGHSSYRRNVNLGADVAFGRGASHVIVLGDDMRPRSPGYANVLATAAGEWTLSYPNDGYQGPKLPTAICMPRGVWAALGGEVLPLPVEHLYSDDYWLALGRGWPRNSSDKLHVPEGIGINYCPSVAVDHLHPHAGKAETDAGYEAIYSSDLPERDGEHWRAYRASGQLEADIRRVRGARATAEALKAARGDGS